MIVIFGYIVNTTDWIWFDLLALINSTRETLSSSNESSSLLGTFNFCHIHTTNCIAEVEVGSSCTRCVSKCCWSCLHTFYWIIKSISDCLLSIKSSTRFKMLWHIVVLLSHRLLQSIHCIHNSPHFTQTLSVLWHFILSYHSVFTIADSSIVLIVYQASYSYQVIQWDQVWVLPYSLVICSKARYQPGWLYFYVVYCSRL